MSPADRFVWTGRFPDTAPGRGADGWNHSRHLLLERLSAASEIVVLDALSFPWQELTSSLRDVPLVVRLPEDLDGEELALLLGEPLLRDLTPYDVLVLAEGRPEVRAFLTERFALYEEVWAHEVAAALPPGSVLRKARFNQLVHEVTSTLSDALPTDALVAVSGEGVLHPRAVEARVACSAARLEGFEQDELPSPDGVVLTLADGGQSRDERVTLFRAAHQVLHPGGQLVVLAHVVSEEGAPPNPWIGELIEELHEATGTSLHLEDLRSVRWAGDALTRGVVLRFTSLRLREV